MPSCPSMFTDTMSRLLRNRVGRLVLGAVGAVAVMAALLPIAATFRTPSVASIRASGPPPAQGYLLLRPPRSYAALPDDSAAARLVHRSSWEIRPENAHYNATRPPVL